MGGDSLEKDAPLTYETLFELVMREKGREELQKIEQGVYSEIMSYIDHKKGVIGSAESAFSSDNDHLLQQLRNIRRLARELYERREKKILNLALIRSRTGSDAIDLSSLLPEEKLLFMSVVEKLDSSRSQVIGAILSENRMPEKKEEPSATKVRFIAEVPKFVGKELEVYGPFRKDEIKDLPKELADVLVTRQKAVYL
jgi:DNA replication initiation complex subunit (GINS family)